MFSFFFPSFFLVLQAVFETRLRQLSIALPLMCCAADMLSVPSRKQVVIVGQKGSEEFQDMVAATFSSYDPNRTVSEDCSVAKLFFLVSVPVLLANVPQILWPHNHCCTCLLYVKPLVTRMSASTSCWSSPLSKWIKLLGNYARYHSQFILPRCINLIQVWTRYMCYSFKSNHPCELYAWFLVPAVW